VQIGGAQGDRVVVQETAGLVVPYSSEYRSNQANPALLAELASVTGGAELAAAADAFTSPGRAVTRAQEIGLPLLLLALLLLPLDIAVRRLMLRRSDLAAFGARFTRRTAPPPAPAATPTLDRLSEAKQRATPRRSSETPPTPPPAPTGASPHLPPTPPPQPPTQSPADDPLERLRQAKERARKRAAGEE
jgi:hypothetical protein